MKVIFTIILLLIAQVTIANQNLSVIDIDLFDDSRQRPVKATVWFPQGQDCKDGTICLSPNVQRNRVVLISHGAMGAANSLNWIGYAMASQGIVAIGLNHYEESWVYGPQTVKPEAAMRLWERPIDMTFVLDQFETNSPFNIELSYKDVTAIGFSSGGSTVLTLAGATYDYLGSLGYCDKMGDRDLGCKYAPKTGEKLPELPKVAHASFKDSRITKAIALDPAGGPLTDSDSLKAIDIPVLIFGLKNYDFLPIDQHAGFYADTIKNAKLVKLEGNEGHFVFMDECDIKMEVHGIPLCSDREGVNRKDVHDRLYPHIFSFIYSN